MVGQWRHLMNIKIRTLEFEESHCLKDFLLLATRFDPKKDNVDELLKNPELNRYFFDWGKQGDLAWVAESESGELISCVWGRCFDQDQVREGEFLSEDFPEIAAATKPDWRGQGIGRKVLNAYLSEIQKFYPSVYLSVRENNPAKKMYETVGFKVVENKGHINRVGSRSVVMRLDF